MKQPIPSAPSAQQWDRYAVPGTQAPSATQVPQLPGGEVTTGVNPYTLQSPEYRGIAGTLPETLGEKFPMMMPMPATPSQ